MRRSVVLLAVGYLGSGCGQPALHPPPSVLLITIDTLRADHLSAYGYFRETSPTLDRLAAAGVLFENTLTTMATTLPAHASLMTATRTTTHGLKGNFEHLGAALPGDSKLTTAAEVFRDAGYRTAAFVSAAPVKDHTGLARGFEVFSQPTEEERFADATVDAALEWLATASDRPFFVWMHFFDPHRPRNPPPPYDKAFTTNATLVEFLEQRAVPGAHDPHIQKENNAYDGEILFTDSQIGRLFEFLKAQGSWSDLAVVVTGDHGEGLGQHHWMRHGRIYNEQLFVPLIVKLPQNTRPAGTRSGALASLIDVVPTLVAALDLPVSDSLRQQFEGVDLLHSSAQRSGVLSEQVHRSKIVDEPGLRFAWTNLRWKYFYRTAAPDELYDMLDDRIETRNVIARQPQVAAQMKAEILEILAESQSQGTSGSRVELDQEVIDQLRALGYTEREAGDASTLPDASDVD